MWDVYLMRCVATLSEHVGGVYAVATLSPGGAHLAVSGAEGVAVVALRTERWRRFDGWAAEALRWRTADVLLGVGREVPRRSSAGDGDEAIYASFGTIGTIFAEGRTMGFRFAREKRQRRAKRRRRPTTE